MDKINLSNIRQSFGNSVYNWKVHEVAAEKLSVKSVILKCVNVMFTALVLLFFLLQTNLFNMPNSVSEIINVYGAIVAVLEIVVLVFTLTFDFDGRMYTHKRTAMAFRSIRDRYTNLITDVINGLDSKTITERRDALTSEFQTICNLAPHTSRGEYLVARSRLKKNISTGLVISVVNSFMKIFSLQIDSSHEDFTLSDEEIDYFLPEGLKSKNL